MKLLDFRSLNFLSKTDINFESLSQNAPEELTCLSKRAAPNIDLIL